MKILSAKREGIAVNLEIERDDGTVISHLIMDGSIESRMAKYELASEEEALEALLIEWHILPPDVFLPEDDNPEIKAIIKKHRSKVKWSGPKKADVIKNMKLPKAKAERVKREALQPVHTGSIYGSEEAMADAKEAYAAGYQKLQEERLADEFVSVLPPERLNAPRAGESPENPTPTVGLAIQFVP